MLSTPETAATDHFPSALFRVPGSDSGLVERIDLFRVAATRQLDQNHRSEMGQFLTPPSIARFMASLFSDTEGVVRLLDAGAGVGTLTAAFVEDLAEISTKPT